MRRLFATLESMSYETFSPRPGTTIGYNRFTGRSGLPGVIFLSGFMSDMNGIKATTFEDACKSRDQSYVRFDYRGRPASSGSFEELGIDDWIEDAADVLDHLTEGPQVLIGSSMGGWISLVLALQKPERIKGLVLLAAAPDFTEETWRLKFTDAQRREVEEKGILRIPSNYGDAYPFSQRLFDGGRKHLLLHDKINVNCPVRLIHSKKDVDVPWQKSEKIKSLLTSEDVEITWIEDGDHRLSREEDMKLADEKVKSLSRASGK